MAPPRKKRLVLLVDIGAIGHRSNRTRFLSIVTASKIVANINLHKKTDEVVVVFVGSRRTRNRLYDEENREEEEGEEDGKYYANVEVLGELKVHTIEYSKQVEDRAREFEDEDEDDFEMDEQEKNGRKKKRYEHKGDILDALTIACDILAQRMEALQGKTAKIANEILLLSPCAEDALGEGSLDENEFARDLVRVMKEKEITLSVGVGIVDGGGKVDDGDEKQKRIGDGATTNANEPKVNVVKLLAEMVEQTKGQIETAMDAIIGRLMRTKTPTTTFRGNLSFGKLGKESYLSIPIWAYKQTMEATAETMKPYGAFEGQDLLRDVQYKNISRIDGDEIPAEQRVRCYKYGKQSIPMDESVERQFGAEKMKKGVEIIGTVDLKYVPFWLTTEEPMLFCAWPELTKDEKAGIQTEEYQKACQALSAFARALDRKGKCALCRACFREGSGIHFGALTAKFLPEGDFLLFSPLPFAEDWRADQVFRENEEFEELPKIDQHRLNIVGSLIDSMTLPPSQNANTRMGVSVKGLVEKTKKKIRVMRPWEMANPNLLRMSHMLAEKALDPETAFRTEKKSHSLPGADEYFAEKYKHLPKNSAIGQLPDAENAAKRIKTSFKLISRDELVDEEEEKETTAAPPTIQEPKDEEDEGVKKSVADGGGDGAAVVVIEDTDDDGEDEEVPLTQPKPSETVWPSSEMVGEKKISPAMASAEKQLKERQKEEADKENEKEQPVQEQVENEENEEDLFEDMD